jgi:hypothetical protein
MTPPVCDCDKCPYLAEWEIHPRRRCPQLVVRLCDDHHAQALATKPPKQELYVAATLMVRGTIGATT